MRCSKCRRLLVEFSEGWLEDKLVQEIRDHLTECILCRRELDDLRSSAELLRSAGLFNKRVLAPSDFTAERIMDRIRQRAKVHLESSRSFVLRIAVACCLLAFISTLFFHLEHPEEQSQTRVSQPQLSKPQVAMIPSKAKIPDTKQNLIRDEDRSMPKPLHDLKASVKHMPKIRNSNKVSIPPHEQILDAGTVPIHNIKGYISMELVRLLEQTLEAIKGDEQEWEVEI